MKTSIFIISFTAFCFAGFSGYSQELGRRASWQASFDRLKEGPGVRVTELQSNSPLAQAGLEVGDILLIVNDRLINSGEDWTAATYAIRAEDQTSIQYRRGSTVSRTSVSLNPLGKESHDNLDTYYESITSDYGIQQRTIITRPRNQTGRLPAIILLQGLSCSTIECHEGRTGNWRNQINYVVERSNMVVMRVDKPGVGDSDGDCSQTDFHTELAGYRAAIRALKAKEYVDPERIVIYGSSMGSALAPLLANEFDLAGVISDGTFFKTWFEHMLEIERRIRQMSGDDESTIVKKMNEAYIPLCYEMLVMGKSYEEAIRENPSLADYNYHGPRHMYGRPVAYYQQLQQFDLAGQWEKVKVPVRIMYGANDWIMSEFDNRMIMDVLDKAGHDDHELLVYPGLDHWNTIHDSPDDSFNGKPGLWDEGVPQQIVDWATEMVNAK